MSACCEQRTIRIVAERRRSRPLLSSFLLCKVVYSRKGIGFFFHYFVLSVLVVNLHYARIGYVIIINKMILLCTRVIFTSFFVCACARARVSSMMYTSTMNGGTNRSGGIFAHKHTGLNVVENCEIEITRAHCSEQKTKYII